MDPLQDPYTPQAGRKPPVMVGREDLETRFDRLLARLERGKSEKGLVVTGLRGVGKTVLLRRFEEIAVGRGWPVDVFEVNREQSFAAAISGSIRRALYSLSPRARWNARALRAAAVLRAFAATFHPDGAVSISLRTVDPAEGAGDSGDFASDLADALIALGEAARDARRGAAFLIDEVQVLGSADLSALIVALHRVIQRDLPIAFVAAGLPQLPRLVGDAGTYAERMFRFPAIGPLGPEDALVALREPAASLGVIFDDDAAGAIVEYTAGYPYLLQEFGSKVWNVADRSPITTDDVVATVPLLEAELDESFFRGRMARVTQPREISYLRAMAELPPGSRRSGAIASKLGLGSSAEVGNVRGNLIEKGLIYSPSVGLADFTVPFFDQFLIRTYPLERWHRRPRRRR